MPIDPRNPNVNPNLQYPLSHSTYLAPLKNFATLVPILRIRFGGVSSLNCSAPQTDGIFDRVNQHA